MQPAAHGLAKYREVQMRQESLILEDYCWGTGSICSFSNSLDNACNAFSEEEDLTQYYKCICGNGYVSTDQA